MYNVGLLSKQLLHKESPHILSKDLLVGDVLGPPGQRVLLHHGEVLLLTAGAVEPVHGVDHSGVRGTDPPHPALPRVPAAHAQHQAHRPQADAATVIGLAVVLLWTVALPLLVGDP